ncbi:MAG: PAS domain S-box protein [Chloroflexi bacterium]|nr:PAS domain S-box protein [Chloroflexota bacterium]
MTKNGLVDRQLYKPAVVGTLLTACLLTMYYFHFVLETEIVFTHFFYVPIVLAGLWWSRKGIAIAVFLAVTLLVSHILSPLDTPTGADVARTMMFIAVGTVVGILNEKRLLLENKLRAYSRTLEQRVEERTVELREAQEQQRAILDGIGDAVIVLDNDLNITWANPIAAEQYGAVPGRKCYQAYKWLEEPCAGCSARKTLADGVVRSSEEDGILKDGDQASFVVTHSPVRGPDGEVVAVVEVFHDITERKRAVETLRETRDYLENLINYANAPIIVWDPELEINRFNHAFERLTGYTADEVIGQKLHLLFPEARRDESLSEIARTLSGEYWESVEIPILRKDGDIRLALWNSANIYAEDGTTLLATIAQGTDITERKRAEEELRKHHEHLEELVKERTAELVIAMEKAQEADRLKSAFLATMSHELRTPLNSIIGFAGIILQGMAGPLNQEQEKQLNMIYASAKHLLDLINDVLDISKIEAGQLEVTSESFDMREAVEKAVRTVTPLADKKGVALVAEVAPAVGQIVSDPRRVEQILINLVNNAVKFTEKGCVRVECEVSDGWLVARVVDTGIGIRPEDMGGLFEAFQQVDTGLARRHEGTGLGLSICKKLVEMLGGEVWAESEWGVGSTFTFTLPV